MQVELTDENPAQADAARGVKRAGGDIRDIDPDALFAMYTEVSQTWTKARTLMCAEAPWTK